MAASGTDKRAHRDAAGGAVTLERVELCSRVCLVDVRSQSSQRWVLGAQWEARIGIDIASWEDVVRKVDVL